MYNFEICFFTCVSLGGDICLHASTMPSAERGTKEQRFSSYFNLQSSVSPAEPWSVHAAGKFLNKLCLKKCFAREDLLQCFGLLQVY